MTNQTVLDWVAALRSGDYQQCTRILHNGSAYCCLGVLTHVVHPEYDFGERAGLPDDVAELLETTPLGRFRLTEKVRAKLLEIFERCELRMDYLPTLVRETANLSSVNDMYRFSFDEIAELIEVIDSEDAWDCWWKGTACRST